MRKYLVAGNWKMHGSFAMNTQLLSELESQLSSPQNQFNLDQVEVLVCPVSVYLQDAKQILSTSQSIKLGAQNVSQHQEGAFTGEISLAMLEELDCQYVILGHSERREYFAETDQIIAEKFAACNASKVTPILCVGETLQERQSDRTEETIASQLSAVIDHAGIGAFANAVIAYEPVWAIGTGETASPEQAQAVHAFIRELLTQQNAEIGEQIQILYGGSVKPNNAPELFAQKDIDGGLIGGASLKADDFAAICLAAG